jgi:transcriptional regulator with XRE-family HTH domain
MPLMKLRKWREAEDMSLGLLARKLKLSASQLSRLERGEVKSVNIETIRAIEKLTDQKVTANDIINATCPP